MTASGANTSTADYLVDRRRLRRGIFIWRVAALVGLVIAVLGVAVGMGVRGTSGLLAPHIARIKIDGVITGDADTLKLLKQVGDSRAAAVILDINSPGGTTTGAEELYDGIRELAAKKPVVAVVGTMAASGGYIAALGADQIVSHGNSLVGSIGVLFTYPNVGKLLDNIGVKVEEVKSSPLKAAPNGFSPTSEQARAALGSLVADSFDWFKALVKERRRLTDEELAKVTDGRVFTGRQSMPLKLVDQLGGEREAVAWLVEKRGVPKGLSVQDWRPNAGLSRWGLFGSAASLARVFGLERLGTFADRAANEVQAATLDGLVSLWHAGQ